MGKNNKEYYVETTTNEQINIFDYTPKTDITRDRTSISDKYSNVDDSTPSNPIYTGVCIGHARNGENGIMQNKAGDASGSEVCIRDIYYPNNGWVVLRATDSFRRDKLATCMERACNNDKIGYDQGDRDTLFENVKNKGYDPNQVTKKVECDCSSLVRLCCYYAGLTPKDFNTSTEVTTLLDLKDSRRGKSYFTRISSNLKADNQSKLLRGDILVQPRVHTAIVVGGNNTANATSTDIPSPYGTQATCEFSINYLKTFNWASGTKQKEIFNKWKSLGYSTTVVKNPNNDMGAFASIDNKILIACTPKFGSVGDRVLWKFSNGDTLDTIIADEKRTTDSGANEWGHDGGKTVLEFCGVPTVSEYANPMRKLGWTKVVTAYKYGKYI